MNSGVDSDSEYSKYWGLLLHIFSVIINKVMLIENLIN